MSLTQTWAPYFLRTIRVRGREYQRDGRVRQIAPQPGEMLRAEVRGSDRTYTVTIRGAASQAEAECTCPFYAKGMYCKHIWAALLDIDQQAMEDDDAQATADASQDDLAIPQPPKARKRTGPRQPMRPTEPKWVSRLSVLRLTSDSMDAPPPTAAPTVRQVYYLIQPVLSNRRQSLVVRVAQRQPRGGGWTRLKQFRFNRQSLVADDSLLDPEDRHLCAMILGARSVELEPTRFSGSTDRPHAVYQLPAGAQRMLLHRMIRTGRCLVEHTTGRSGGLAWDGDEPWCLWAVGRESETGLELSLELRRGEDRMAVDEPAVILPGQDGVVLYHGQAAPLDDAGATRWIRHFRDETDTLGDIQPIHVPRGDIDRFLERLYQMPTLPHLDLPADVAWRKRVIQPVPHLDLFSSTHADRDQPIKAEVFFDYDGHRVTRGQQGSHITIPPAEQRQGNGEDVESNDQELLPKTGEAPQETERKDVVFEPTQTDRPWIIPRDRVFERQAIAFLQALGFQPSSQQESTVLQLKPRLLPRVVDILARWGWKVRADRRLVYKPTTPRLSVTSGIDWFELRGSVSFQTESGEVEVPLPQILAAAREGRAMVTLDDGSQGLLPQQWLAEHGLLAAVATMEDDHLRFKSSQTALLDALLSQTQTVDVDQQFARARDRLKAFDGIEPIEAGEGFEGELRPYQKDGLGWLAFLRQFAMGGILADDMGLGKTIQMLAMFDHWYHDGADNDPPRLLKPSLIVVPRSVVFNWIDEAARFTPRLRVQAYTGPERHAVRETFDACELIVTSYGLLRRDIDELRQQPFSHVVLDEAQAIKNPQSQSAKAARLLQADYRLALTGTPVENHLGDLWSIFEFLNPGMLGHSARFAELVQQSGGGRWPARRRQPGLEDWRRFVPPEEGGQSPHRFMPSLSSLTPPDDASAPATPVAPATPAMPRHLHAEEAASMMGKALRPFILRRTKKEVLDELPDKTEQTLVCQMEPAQRKVYNDLIKYYRGSLLKKLDASSGSVPGSAMMVLEALLRLRQAACHPRLINSESATHAPSAKLELLLDRVHDLIEEGHKALVFSQFTSFLALVREQLDKREVPYEYLDGQTRNRRQRVERFQTDPDCPLFLISLKAGGLGLNLTAASYVFILDPWWNPAVEAQAIDRAHRIGQTRHVFAYRLICEDTVEQRIIELQQKKRQLADAIVGGQDNLLKSLTREDLERLLS